MSNILIITTEFTSIKGAPTGGRGARIENLRDGLVERGHNVNISFLKENIDILEKKNIQVPIELKKYSHLYYYDEIIEVIKPNVIIFSPWTLALYLTNEKILEKIPIVIDMPGFLSLENIFDETEIPDMFFFNKIAALNKADLFCVSNPRQKYFLYPFLMANGFDLKDNPVIITSISKNTKFLERLEEYPTPPVLVFGGVLWGWQNYGHSLKTIAEYCDEKGGSFNLYCGNFLYRKESKILDNLKDYKNTKLFGLIEYADLLEYYQNASVAIELYLPNVEREFATTTRTFDFLWAGLPVIYTKGMYLADFIKEYDAGWVIDPENKDELINVLNEIYADPQICKIKGQNAQKLLKEKFNNYDAVAELSDFCNAPRKRKNNKTFIAYLSETLFNNTEHIKNLTVQISTKDTEIKQLQHLNNELDKDLTRIKNRFVFKLLLKIKKSARFPFLPLLLLTYI